MSFGLGDMDSFDFFEQEFHNPASPTGFDGTIDPSQMMLGSGLNEDRNPFNGPSYEYGAFRQLTGLPNGSVSNFTAMSQISHDGAFDLATAGPSPSTFNFTTPEVNNLNMDFDLSRQEPMPAYFFPTYTSDTGNYISPMSLGSQEVPVPSSNNRLWPGVHSRQAQQAKAEAAARQQRQQQMGQQIMQQRQQQSIHTEARHSVSNPSTQTTPTNVNDQAVDDRISRLLDQMRHNSAASMEDEGDEHHAESSRNTRTKKDEEDMDEDERLLASEEGKKLSSKERRQLRNKVSARAFRSRRKGYITQLEAELAVKSTECDELKARNRNLTDQNQQLTRLTQTLLRHPAFSTFLNDMSTDPSILDLPIRTTQQNVENFQQVTKQETPDSHQESQFNMAVMPQTMLDLSMLNLGPSHWNASNTSGFSFQQPQVYSVLELPRGPSLDDHFALSKASGKGEVREGKNSAPKVELPSFALMESKEEEAGYFNTEGIDKDDPAFALYLNSPPSITTIETTASEPVKIFSSLGLTDKPNTIALFVRASAKNDVVATTQINALFDNLMPTYRRVWSLTAHVPY